MAVRAPGRPAPRVTMFCSTEDNIGQTTTMVNVALALAEKGRRVLILDARGGGLRAGQYLSTLSRSGDRPPAPGERVGATDTGTAETGASRSTETPAAVEMYRSRTGGGVIRLITVEVTVEGPAETGRLVRFATPDSPEGRIFPGYDHVLIDAPTARTDAERADLARLPNMVVACFTLNSWSIEGAADLARDVRARAQGPVTVVAAGLKADTRMVDQFRIARTYVHTAFQDMADDGLHYVEIPYDASYVFADHLSTDQPSDTATDLRPYFARLADELVNRRSTQVRR